MVVLTLDAVARPALFRPRLIDLTFTVLLTGVLRMVATFCGTAAFGIEGGELQSRRVDVGVEVRWHNLVRTGTCN